MIFEILVSILTPFLLLAIGKLFAPEKPHPEKILPFLGGEMREVKRAKYMYVEIITFIFLYLVIDMFIFVMALSFTNRVWAAIYAVTVLLGVLSV